MLHRMLLQGHDSRGRPWPPPLVTPTDKELCENIGTFGGQGDENVVLFDAVPIEASPLVMSGEEHQEALQKSITDGGSRLPRILCMVYTMESEHATRIRAIRETWAPGCDGFLAFSTKSDPRIPAISLPHEGPEAYENMWQVCYCQNRGIVTRKPSVFSLLIHSTCLLLFFFFKKRKSVLFGPLLGSITWTISISSSKVGMICSFFHKI